MSEAHEPGGRTADRPSDEPHADVPSRFEAAWRRALSGPPRVEEFLADVPEPARPALRRAMEHVEREYRRLWESRGRGHPAADTPGPPGQTVDHVPPPPSREPGRSTEGHAATSVRDSAAAVPQAGGATVDESRGEVLGPVRSRPPAPPVEEGVRIPGYVVEGELGRGGMGVVYKARHVELDRPVALKMILAGAQAAPEQRERFYAEARAVAKLQHPHIVQIYEINEQDGLPWFALEFVEGGSLDRKINRTPQPAREAAQLVETLARAMAVAHDKKIIHRDLKPANVLIAPDGTPKITDFGLAKRLEGDSGQTRAGSVVGTPSYMAPEQASGDLESIGPLSDVYALGAILYDLLTGRPPFRGPTILDTLEQVRSQEPVPPAQLNPNCPADLETVCLKCLQKEPARRYAGARELADDLRRFLNGEPIRARPVSAPERLWRWSKRNPWVAGLTAAVFTTLLVGLVVSLAFEAKARRERDAAETAREQERLAKEQEITARIAEAEARRKEQEARQKEEAANTRARTRANALMDIVRTAIFKIQDDLRYIPAAQPVRESLLKVVQDQLATVGREMDQDPFVDRYTAATHAQMGNIFLRGGRRTDALKRYEQAHAIITRLVEQQPQEPRNTRALANTYNLQADALVLLGDAPKARDYYRRALAVREKWAAMVPGHPDAKQAIAESYGLIGNISLKLGEPAAARDSYRRSLATYEALPKDFPRNPVDRLKLRQERAALDQRLGLTSLQLGELAEARKYLDAARTQRQELIPASRGTEVFLGARRDHAYSLIDQGDVALTWLDNPSQALADYQAAAAELQKISDEWRESRTFQQDVAVAHYRLGTACLRLAQRSPGLAAVPLTAAAHAHYERARQTYEQLATLDKEDADAQVLLLLAQARCGRHEAAAALADRVAKNSPHDARILFHAACGYGLCAAAAAADRAKADDYAKRGREALDRAVAAGWKDAVALERDPDLDPLRARPEFAAVLRRLRPDTPRR